MESTESTALSHDLALQNSRTGWYRGTDQRTRLMQVDNYKESAYLMPEAMRAAPIIMTAMPTTSGGKMARWGSRRGGTSPQCWDTFTRSDAITGDHRRSQAILRDLTRRYAPRAP